MSNKTDSNFTEEIVKNTAVELNASPRNREEAIRAVGQLLVDSGAVEKHYIESMLKREQTANTWLGDGVAIPHGMAEDKGDIKADKVAILQVPEGVEWSDGETARLIFGIAARGEGHLAVLRRLTQLLQKPDDLKALYTTKDAEVITKALSSSSSTNEPKKEVHDLEVVEKWKVDYPNGLHARPSSAWMDAAKKAGIQLQVRNGDQVSDIKSLASLLQLGAKCGDELVFSAAGDDAKQKLADFIKTVKSLSQGEIEQAQKAEEQKKKALANSWRPPSGQTPIMGIPASPGLAIGVISYISHEEPEIEDKPLSPAKDGALLQDGLEKARQHCQYMADDVGRRIGKQDAQIFKAQAEWLNDEGLVTSACNLILEGHGAAFAWSQASKEAAERLSKMDNPVLAGRAADLRDVSRRVLENIDSNYTSNDLDALPEGEKYIVTAEDLLPSDTAGLDTEKVCGLAMTAGGPTSHTAILARTMGLPALVGAGSKLAAVKNGTKAIINGDNGAIWADPSDEDLKAAKDEIAKVKKKQEQEAKERRLPAKTTDGHGVIIAANINTPDQAAFALDQGAEGVGLMRTEFLFIESSSAPDEESQYNTYRAMLDALDGKSLIVRALDIGGDKQVSYLNLPHEDNPFLGVRGSRLLLRRQDLLYPQLKALYRAAKEGGDLSIMFPMIMSVDEVLELKETAEKIRQELDAPKVPLGIMVEIPSAAICADQLAKHVDFFSIGTNDLTQYTLAADRQNSDLAAQADGFNPAVLRMIKRTVEGAKQYKRFVGVCGGLAGDPFGAVLLTGLGVDELSMTPRDVAAVKARLRELPYTSMQELAEKACNAKDSDEVRALFNKITDAKKSAETSNK